MKINMNSWHYKLMDRIGIIDPYNRTNLCSYIRGLLITLFILIWLITAPFIFYLMIPILNSKPNTIIDLIIVLYAISGSIIDLVIILIILVNIYVDKILPCLPTFPEKRKKLKEPNIFIEYLKAKKEKICPIIEFVEE